jgi:4-hydroxythreonine-4-phosphate dehydrogenase
MTSAPTPLVASLGEPAGAGADVMLHACAARMAGQDVPPFVVAGCADTVEARAAHLDLDKAVPVVRAGSMAQAITALPQGLPVLDMPLDTPAVPGQPSAAHAAAVIGWIAEAARLVMAGEAGGMVTGPIQKETLYQAGFAHQGHTDYLAHLARQAGHDAEPVMMLSAETFRTVPLSVHVPLADVPALVSGAAIIAQGRIIHRDLARHFGIAAPRIAVAGLNPHAGEGGRIGTEDRDVIAPAVNALRSEGINASGPHPADTMFHEEARARYDVALCMYHDQALIPVKTLGFHVGVNTTLGLPFVRTSPDHGTALDVAGTGGANPSSFIAALKAAQSMTGRCTAT